MVPDTELKYRDPATRALPSLSNVGSLVLLPRYLSSKLSYAASVASRAASAAVCALPAAVAELAALVALVDAF